MSEIRSLGRVVILLVLTLVGAGLVGAGPAGSAGTAWAATSGGTVTVAAMAETNALPPATAPKGAGNVIDANSVFFGCAVGTMIGVLVTALPPLVGWAFFAGALPAFMAMVATSGVGCSIGLFGGVVVSTFHWLFTTIGSAWMAVFG